MKIKVNNNQLLYLSGYFALMAVLVSSYLALENVTHRVIVTVILLSIGIIFSLESKETYSPVYSSLRMAVQTLLVCGLFFIQPGWSVFPMVFFILAPQVMIDFPPKIGEMWIGIFILVSAVSFFYTEGIRGFAYLLPFAAGYIFFGLFGWVMAQAKLDRDRSEKYLAELKEAHEQLKQYTGQLEELTIARERNRIAREMHDTLGHRLTVVSVQLEGAQRLIPTHPEKSAQILGTVREQVREGLSELRRTVAMLRASVDEDLPLPQALARLVDQMREATGMDIHLSIAEDFPALNAAQRQALFRAAQEGLTNIQRHAQAGQAWLNLTREGEKVSLTVSDDGVGLTAAPESLGFGLTGLQERAALLNGSVEVGQRPGGGAQLVFSIPIAEEKSQ